MKFFFYKSYRLKSIYEMLQDNRQIVLEAVTNSPLIFVSNIENNKQVVLEAVTNSPLIFVSNIENNRQLVLEAVTNSPLIFVSKKKQIKIYGG